MYIIKAITVPDRAESDNVDIREIKRKQQDELQKVRRRQCHKNDLKRSAVRRIDNRNRNLKLVPMRHSGLSA
jgi:hypothetical protein